MDFILVLMKIKAIIIWSIPLHLYMASQLADGFELFTIHILWNHFQNQICFCQHRCNQSIVFDLLFTSCYFFFGRQNNSNSDFKTLISESMPISYCCLWVKWHHIAIIIIIQSRASRNQLRDQNVPVHSTMEGSLWPTGGWNKGEMQRDRS